MKRYGKSPAQVEEKTGQAGNPRVFLGYNYRMAQDKFVPSR
jgi:hypothetical protein